MTPALPDLSIRQLEYLAEVADAPTWAVAAERLGVSPSALSQGLAELERRVGVTLFSREGRRRLIRPGAAPVVEHARRVLALTGDLARWADRTRSGTAGEMRLGLIDVAAVHHYPDVLRRFREQRPEVRLRLVVAPSRALIDDVARGELDLAVCVAPPTPRPGLQLTPLLDEDLAVYPPAGAMVGSGPDWGPWVLFPSGSHTRDVVEEALHAAGAPVDVVAESHQPEVLREMVGLGLGWTVLPVVQAELGERPLERARILATRRLVTVVRDAAVPDPVVSGLTDALLSP